MLDVRIALDAAGDAQPVAWVAADTLNSPHPTCISSLAYMSQIDRERGREYVPLAIIDRYAAPSSAQPAVNGYTCTVPDDCETLHWRGQILSMNELASVAQPGVGEEIHVHIEGQDVLTLPLASSGMDAPRFVVHVPAQAQQPVSGADGLPDSVIEAIARAHGTGGWQSLSDMVRFGRALLTHLSAQPHPTQHNDGGAVYD